MMESMLLIVIAACALCLFLTESVGIGSISQNLKLSALELRRLGVPFRLELLTQGTKTFPRARGGKRIACAARRCGKTRLTSRAAMKRILFFRKLCRNMEPLALDVPRDTWVSMMVNETASSVENFVPDPHTATSAYMERNSADFVHLSPVCDHATAVKYSGVPERDKEHSAYQHRLPAENEGLYVEDPGTLRGETFDPLLQDTASENVGCVHDEKYSPMGAGCQLMGTASGTQWEEPFTITSLCGSKETYCVRP